VRSHSDIFYSTWDFSATTASAADTKAKEEEPADNPWSLDRAKPKKKKVGLSFGGLEEEEVKSTLPDAVPEKKDSTFDFGFTKPTDKKDKKKKKGGVLAYEEQPEEIKEEPAPIIETPTINESAAADDSWGGGWGAAKPKKKGSKGTDPEPAKEEPKVEEPAPADDPWSLGTTKKKGKKAKGVVEETLKVRSC
jgi:hypothetical protein